MSEDQSCILHHFSHYCSLSTADKALLASLEESPVHVSRTFSLLSEEGLVFRDRHNVTIPDLQALAAVGEFDDCYLNGDVRPLFELSA
ncbi:MULTISPECIES: helix-turn-helix domain-containing protein [unclassified Halomonas]|uniref:helix-turn-helix domain-containing protein n=1 Tax=unclassified Halomonas TaxID=2609666 RepID=UPI004033A3BD